MTFPPGSPHIVPRNSSRAIEISIQNTPVGAMVDIVNDFSVGVYLSSRYGAGCRPTPIKLWGTTVRGGLRAGESRRFSITITIPTTITPGVYYMYPMVDDTYQIPERNEEGNCHNSVALKII